MIKKLYTKIFKLADYATTKNIRKMHYQTPFSLYEEKNLIYIILKYMKIKNYQQY